VTRVDRQEAELLAASLREVLAAAPQDVDRLLAELGWHDVVAEDPAAAVRLLFTEHGRQLARTSLLDSIVLAELPAYETVPTVVVYPTRGYRPSSTRETVVGLSLRRPEPDSVVCTPVQTPQGLATGLLPAADLRVQALATFDPGLPWCAVVSEKPPRLVPGEEWPAAVAAAHRALAVELLQLAREALRLAIEHTSTRRQFGAPIAAFQAVRHRLADAYTAITSVEGLIDVAYDRRDPLSAKVAKAQAGRAHQQVSSHVLQVCGAMGATLEHPLHRYVARGVVLDSLLGDWQAIADGLGASLTPNHVPALGDV
jgi:hypothetical protein